MATNWMLPSKVQASMALLREIAPAAADFAATRVWVVVSEDQETDEECVRDDDRNTYHHD